MRVKTLNDTNFEMVGLRERQT